MELFSEEEFLIKDESGLQDIRIFMSPLYFNEKELNKLKMDKGGFMRI